MEVFWQHFSFSGKSVVSDRCRLLDVCGSLYIIHIWYLDVLTCAELCGKRVANEPALEWTISSRRRGDVSATNSQRQLKGKGRQCRN